MEQIIVNIAADASISYEVKGVKGGKCRDLTRAIDAISGKVLETKNTGEFCQVPNQARIKAGG